MTNEEARAYFIKCNENLISVAKDENVYNFERQQIETICSRRAFEANKLAIKALEQEPCEDTISRRAAISIIQNWLDFDTGYSWGEKNVMKCIIDELRNLPSASTENPNRCGDAISRQAVNKLIDELARAISDERCFISRGRSPATIMQDILDLPSVSTEKTGHWKKLSVGYGCSECSLCTNKHGIEFYRYCPNCGAKMEVEE